MNKQFIVLVSGVASLGGLLFGFDTAVISGAIPYITTYFKLDGYMLGWAVGAVLLGCALGAVLAGNLADRFGRKWVLLGCAVLFAISGIGAACSHTLTFFILFRLIGGLGVGAAAMVSPMYIAETAPDNWRGRLVACYQLAIVLGILLAYFSNYYFDNKGADNWRYMFASQAAPAILFFFLLLLVPETPRWLAGKGRFTDAAIIVQKSGNVTTEQAARQVQEMTESFHSEEPVKLNSLFSSRYRPVVWIGILLAVFQQVTGINAILYYAPSIFTRTGLDSSSSLEQTIIIGAVNVLATFIAIGLVDKLGRRKFLLSGSLVMGLCLLAIALCFKYNYFGHYLVLVFMLLYVAGFGCTLGAVTWVALSEIFPNRIRGLALSMATLALWLADFLVSWAFPSMINSSLGITGTMLVYAFFCILAFFFVMAYLPETRGKSLEDMENLFVKESD